MAESNLRTLLASARATGMHPDQRLPDSEMEAILGVLKGNGDQAAAEERPVRQRADEPRAEALATTRRRLATVELAPRSTRRGVRERAPRDRGPPPCSAASMPSARRLDPTRRPGIADGTGSREAPASGRAARLCRIGRSIPPASGTTSSSAFVYGWRGRSSTSSAGPISTILPRYITATRSATVHARPRSCVTIRIDSRSVVAKPEEQLQDLAAHRSVQVGDGLVRHDHLRVEHQRAGDHDPLPLPAGELVGVQQVEALGRPHAGPRERPRDELLLRLAVRSLVDLVDPESFGDALVDRLAGIERRGRVLEDHLDLSAVGLRASARAVSPRNEISPPFGRIRPMIARASVVFPHPDSPASARTSPS